MQITLEINNPRLIAGLEDMAQAAGLDVQTLATGLVERQVYGYNHDVRGRKCEAVSFRLTERLNRIIAEKARPLDPAEEDE